MCKGLKWSVTCHGFLHSTRKNGFFYSFFLDFLFTQISLFWLNKIWFTISFKSMEIEENWRKPAETAGGARNYEQQQSTETDRRHKVDSFVSHRFLSLSVASDIEALMRRLQVPQDVFKKESFFIFALCRSPLLRAPRLARTTYALSAGSERTKWLQSWAQKRHEKDVISLLVHMWANSDFSSEYFSGFVNKKWKWPL